ncbi:MAG: hypothetical protein BHW39_04495 [Firmicutes bacterium CAG:552_39_19]|nr:MAG: hypothetical protein BHW39_04495 [Firmicutes bacterium CAG:552_39_19]
MTHKTRRTKIFTLALGLAMCFAVILGIASVNPQSAYAETTTIDTLEVAFKKVNVGDSLAAAFEFENETERTLKVPAGANYTATLQFVSKDGQAKTLWEKDKASFPWSRVENQLIEQKVAYCIRIRFELKENHKLSKDVDSLKRKLKVSGAELGKGKDVELWDIAGQFADLTAIDMDFIISKGLTYIGYRQTVYPKIDEEVTGKIGTLYTGTGMWLRGAPGPYAYTVKTAPVGTKLDKHDGFNDDASTCYYQIIAKNAMDGGTMYITVTAADGQTCDIPVTIAAVSGGHEHTWVDEIEKIDYEHHGYTKCTDPTCPGVAPAFDKGSQYASHEFYSGCNAKCKKCGDLGNPDAKHNFTAAPDESDATCHVLKCGCGEFEKDASGKVKKEEHSGGEQTCLSGAQCDTCGEVYLAATGHKYEFKSFGSLDGTYMHLGFCKYCKEEDTSLRHSPAGGTATCQKKAKCAYEKNGAACGLEHGDFLPHNFVNGTCTECSSDKYIKEVLIDVPEFYKGMAYEAMFYPTVIKGNVIDLGINYHIASFSRNGNGYLSGPHNFKTTFITENSVMQYAFKPQTNCTFPENIDDLSVKVTRGEVLSKKIRDNNGNLVVLVLLRVESVVQSIDIEISQPLAGLSPETITVAEKNRLEVTVNNVSGYLYDGLMTLNRSMQVEVTINAPEGKTFQTLGKTTIENWLCELNINGGNLSSYTQSTDLKEITFVFQTKPAIECPHETVILEAGKTVTCTEDGIKDKYVCVGCGAAFFDAVRTMEWNASGAVIPKGHLGIRHDATPCSDGKDGNIEYYECQRKECGKLFKDAACNTGITLEQTIIHDFDSEYSIDKENHYHKCKNCDAKKDVEAHVFGEWVKEVAPTIEDYGVTAHKDCTVCARHFDNDGNEIADLRIAKIGTHKVTVNFGTINDKDDIFFKEGATVTVKANAPEAGKVFKGWKDESGNIVGTYTEYTFTVTGETTLTAVYEDAPVAKKGLSGGGIAGIVIGSVAVAGLGGFAIYWFVVRKKTFADLIAAIKGIFEKKQ